MGRGRLPAARKAANARLSELIRGRNDDRARMCTSGQIIGSLLVLSVLEIGLGVSSVAVGAVSFSLVFVDPEQKTQLGDSSPVWSGVCVR